MVMLEILRSDPKAAEFHPLRAGRAIITSMVAAVSGDMGLSEVARTPIGTFPFVVKSKSSAYAAASAAFSAAEAADSNRASGPATYAITTSARAIEGAKAVALEAARLDAKRAEIASLGPEDIYRLPLWHGSGQPKSINAALKSIGKKSSLRAGPWAFWLDWYQAFLNGNPMNWEMQREISLISHEDWQFGAAHIAELIDEIRRRYGTTAPGQAQLVRHIQTLIRDVATTELVAESTAVQIETAVSAFLREAQLNRLPDELELMQDMPPLFRRISATVSSGERESDLEAELRAEVDALHARIVELETNLEAALQKSLKGAISRNAAESFGKTLGSPWFIGALALGTCHFLGATPSDITLENLRAYAGKVIDGR